MTSIVYIDNYIITVKLKCFTPFFAEKLTKLAYICPQFVVQSQRAVTSYCLCVHNAYTNTYEVVHDHIIDLVRRRREHVYCIIRLHQNLTSKVGPRAERVRHKSVLAVECALNRLGDFIIVRSTIVEIKLFRTQHIILITGL